MGEHFKIGDRIVVNQVWGEQGDQIPRVKKLFRIDKRLEKKSKKQRDRISVLNTLEDQKTLGTR